MTRLGLYLLPVDVIPLYGVSSQPLTQLLQLFHVLHSLTQSEEGYTQPQGYTQPLQRSFKSLSLKNQVIHNLNKLIRP